PGSSKGSTSSALQRGKACLNCRRRKMKCDGVRPVCGPCDHAGRGDDCEYTDGQGRSRTKMLEETIGRLEARIHELENPDNSAPNVMLHDPQKTIQMSSPVSYSGHQSPTGAHSSAPSPVGSEFYYQASTFPIPWQTADATQISGLRGASSHVSGWDPDDLPPNVAAELTDIFFQNTGQLPWFLHQARFRERLALPSGSFGRPISALLSITYLWGIKFASTDVWATYEPGFLSQALSDIGHALAGQPSHHIVQVIQAHVLLATYLYHVGRFLEGRHHTDAAASLAIHCRLHKIRSAQPTRTHVSYMDPVEIALPEPRDQIEEGERINAFWTAFEQDRVWAVVLGVPTVIFDVDGAGTQIDTPWPLEMEVYEQGQIYPDLRTSGTLKNFFGGINSSWPWEINSALTQLCKASALFERATRLAVSWRPVLPSANAYYTEFVSLDSRIEEFKATLAPLESFAQLRAVEIQQAYTVHCIAQSATIQLHAAFAGQTTASRTKCLNAAFAILHLGTAAQVHNFAFLDHAAGSMWAAVCRVLINEIITLRSQYVDPSIPAIPGREAELISALDQLQASMAAFAPTSALMS
ncbi:hypothetical protein K488DRAFT_27143, partial [Vararia minispora EC-137]